MKDVDKGIEFITSSNFSWEAVELLGFKHIKDGTGSVWGNWWDYENEKFKISIDVGGEVELHRKVINEDGSDNSPEGLPIMVANMDDLETLIDFITD